MAIKSYEYVEGNAGAGRRRLFVCDTTGELDTVTWAQLYETGIVGTNTYRWNGSVWEADLVVTASYDYGKTVAIADGNFFM